MRVKRRLLGERGQREWEGMRKDNGGEYDLKTLYTCMQFSKNKK